MQLAAHQTQSLPIDVIQRANGEMCNNKAIKRQTDAVRYLREESPCWAAGSTASEECWLDGEELRLVSTDLERSDELGYQRSACWRLIACGSEKTSLIRSSHINNNIKLVTKTHSVFEVGLYEELIHSHMVVLPVWRSQH